MTDVIQQLCAEMDETVNGRIDMLISINTALQKVSAKPAVSKPCRSSDPFLETGKAATTRDNFDISCRTCTCGCKRGQEGETMAVSIESTDKFDDNPLAVDCSDEEFRAIEASVYKVLHRTTASEALLTVQQTRGQKEFEGWRAIARRHHQRNMSGKKSAYAALISSISERDRVEDVEQFDDITTTFINETNEFENRFGIIKDEENVRSQEIDTTELVKLQIPRNDDAAQ